MENKKTGSTLPANMLVSIANAYAKDKEDYKSLGFAPALEKSILKCAKSTNDPEIIKAVNQILGKDKAMSH